MGRGTEAVPFGTRLRRLRESAGLTQEELAAEAGLTARGISDLERGVRKRPYPHTVRSIAGALNLSEDDRATLLASVPRRSSIAAPATASETEPLPAPSTSLVGRERELGDDLLGPGGAGLGVSGDDDVVVAEAEIVPDGGIEVMVVKLPGLRRLH